MPQIPVKASDDYLRWMDRVAKLARQAGHAVESRADLVGIALDALGKQLGAPEPPARANPKGTNRFGTPKDALAPPPAPKRRGRPRKAAKGE